MKWSKSDLKWYNEREQRAKEDWSNYSKWTTLLQKDLDNYDQVHAEERGAIVARLESQGYSKDNPVYIEAIKKMETRQQADIEEAQADLDMIRKGATRDLLIGDGHQINDTPYSDYMRAISQKKVVDRLNYYDSLEPVARHNMWDDPAFESISARNMKYKDYISRANDTKKAYFEGSSKLPDIYSMADKTYEKPLEMEEFYTRKFGVWKESPESIQQQEEIAGLKTARSSTLQRSYKSSVTPRGMAGGAAAGSEFDLPFDDDEKEQIDLTLKGF